MLYKVSRQTESARRHNQLTFTYGKVNIQANGPSEAAAAYAGERSMPGGSRVAVYDPYENIFIYEIGALPEVAVASIG